MDKKLMMAALVACVMLGAHGRAFSLDLRNPAKGGARFRLAAPVSSQDDGALRSFNLDAGVADVGEVSVGDELSFTLFDDVAIRLKLTEKMPSSLGDDVFIAEVAGYEGIKTAVVIRTSDGLSIDVQDISNKKYYKVLSSSSCVKVQEMEARDGTCGCDAFKQRRAEAQLSTVAEQSLPRRLSSPSGQGETYVDILVAYDKNAALWAEDNGGGITNFAEISVQKMNEAIANTGLDTSFHFRLVGVMQIALACSNLVYALEAATDGYSGWESIRANRERIGADIVTVFIDTGTAGGMSGWSWCLDNEKDVQQYFSDNAYNVCSIRAVAQSHTMTHEVGHNMGCGHWDRQSFDPGPQLYGNSSGYYFSVGEETYHTIMAYGTDGPGGSEVPYFSSPNYTYLGIAVGDEQHDNTHTISRTFAAVAAWREAKDGEIEPDDGNWPIEWVTSCSQALALAKPKEKKIFLVSGSDSHDKTREIREACESPDVKRHLKANYICWYNLNDTQAAESSPYFKGYAVGKEPPYIAIIDEKTDTTLSAEGGCNSAESLRRMLGRASDEIVFSPEPGTFSADSLRVSISSKLGGEIFYTLDGTMPDRDAIQYSGPITVAPTVTIRARTVLPDGELGLAHEAVYAQREFDGSAMVTVSVARECGEMGKVTGGNAAFKTGEKVPIKATANKGAAFEGWFINNVRVSDAAAYTYAATGREDVEIIARFVAMADDRLSVKGSDKEFGAGAPVSLALADCFAVDSASAVTSLAISGLPTGVKYDANKRQFAGTAPAKAGLFYVTCTVKNGNGYQFVATSVWNVGRANSGDGDEGQIGWNALAQLDGLVTGQICLFRGFTAATAVSGLPSGLKFDKTAGVISGVPTKPGKATIAFTGANKKKSQRTVVVADGGMHVLKLVSGRHSSTSANAAGTVAGGGVYAAGKSVAITATPAKGSVFAGWFDAEGKPLVGSADFRSASFPYVMGVENVVFTARFATAAEDSSVEVGVEDSYETGADGSFNLTIPVTSISAPALKVTGLPTGLKFDAKTLTISGTATKPGVYAVKITATNVSVKKGLERTFELRVPNLLPEKFKRAGLADSYDCVAGKAPDGVAGVISRMVGDGWKLTLSGLPSGFKYDDRSRAITGIATKEGKFTVYFTATKDKEKQIATATFDVVFPTLALELEAFGTVNATNKATVTGGGRYPVGKKVTLKATPAKGNVFLGWRRATEEPYLSQSASFNYVTTDADATFVAVFTTAVEDARRISLSVNGATMPDTTTLATNLFCGVAVSWPVCPDALSATTVKVSGLPTGLKFTDKGVFKKGSKTEYDVPPNTIYGAPTAASKIDSKTQKSIPSVVKISITTAGKSTKTYAMEVVVEALPAWAVGTFDGGLLNENGDQLFGLMQGATIASSGKISGKVTGDDGSWTLSANSFDAYDDGKYVATVIGKNGKLEFTNVLAVVCRGIEGVACGEVVMQAENGLLRGFQNLWKSEPWKSDAKLFANKKLTIPIRGSDTTDQQQGTLDFKFEASGAVKASGTFVVGQDSKGNVTYSATCSSTLLLRDADGYYVYVYFPRKADKFDGYSAVIRLKWNGEGFETDGLSRLDAGTGVW